MMRSIQTLLPLGMLLLVAGFVIGARTGAPPRARLVSAEIKVDDQLVLTASTSDDGRPDADAVWGYLSSLDFKPTDAFASLGIDADSETVTIGWLKSRENASKGPQPRISVEVAYGGRDAPWRLSLIRNRTGGTWRVTPEQVERRFGYRWIRREQAAQLLDPRRKN